MVYIGDIQFVSHYTESSIDRIKTYQ